MSVEAVVNVEIAATKTTQSGLATAVAQYPVRLTVEAGDCTKVWSTTATFPGTGHVDTFLAANAGMTAVKLVYVKNLSTTSSIALTAGWNGTDFRNFIPDIQSWNFSPMVNLGNLTLRGYPIRPRGAFLLSCPNSEGFSTASGGDLFRVGGVVGQSFELYLMGS
jgi:hypothetical protein